VEARLETERKTQAADNRMAVVLTRAYEDAALAENPMDTEPMLAAAAQSASQLYARFEQAQGLARLQAVARARAVICRFARLMCTPPDEPRKPEVKERKEVKEGKAGEENKRPEEKKAGAAAAAAAPAVAPASVERKFAAETVTALHALLHVEAKTEASDALLRPLHLFLMKELHTRLGLQAASRLIVAGRTQWRFFAESLVFADIAASEGNAPTYDAFAVLGEVYGPLAAALKRALLSQQTGASCCGRNLPSQASHQLGIPEH
jgi:hypothetical protein